jgi:hypothetical protein
MYILSSGPKCTFLWNRENRRRKITFIHHVRPVLQNSHLYDAHQNIWKLSNGVSHSGVMAPCRFSAWESPPLSARRLLHCLLVIVLSAYYKPVIYWPSLLISCSHLKVGQSVPLCSRPRVEAVRNEITTPPFFISSLSASVVLFWQDGCRKGVTGTHTQNGV